MMIPAPQSNRRDIFAFGFDRTFRRTIEVPQSSLVYDTIQDRMSRLVQTGETITSLIPGLIEVELEESKSKA